MIRVPANGLNFEVAVSATNEPCEGGRLAICLHGFPEHAFSWRHQISFLESLGYRVWAPNLRGYGNSHSPGRVADYRTETLLEDVAALIRAARAEETMLIGHDWGGVLAWGIAMRYRRLIDRLVILNAPHPALMLRELRRPRQMMRSWYMLAFRIPVLPELLLRAGNYHLLTGMMRRTAAHPGTFDDISLDVYRRNAARPGALTAMINWYRAIDLRTPRTFPQIETKTLIVWGERDPFLGPALLEGLGPYVADLEIHRIPHASHWVQQEATREVNERIAAWLRQHPITSAALPLQTAHPSGGAA